MKQIYLILLMMLGWAFHGQAQGANGIEAGKTYRIALGSDTQKSLFVRNAVPDNLAPVVLWTETNVPAQQWTAEADNQGRFAFKNVYTGKYLNFASGSTCQYGSKLWWVLEPAGDNGNTFYMKRTNSYLHVDGKADDTMPVMGEAQEWAFIEAEPQTEFNEAVRLRMADGFLRQYMQDKGTGYRTFVNGGWGESETLEALLDMYEGTGDRRFLSAYESCYSYFKYHVGQTWTGGTQVGGYGWYGYSFNDDVMWHIIGAARAYLLTGNSLYINDARRNFDLIWNRAYLDYVGLLRWAEQDGDRNGANSCINGPAEVAACYIALATGDESYYEKAKLLYENQRTYLANMSTGQVYDSAIFDPATGKVKDNSINYWASTYNQGTMLGAAVLLYQHYGDDQYKADANKIIAYSRSNFCDANGIIKVCQNADGDFQGFKGILMRYVGLYVRQFNVERYATWLKANAMRAFCNMNSRGFGHSAWLTKAAENLRFGDVDYSGQAFGASTSLSAAFSVATEAPAVTVQESGGSYHVHADKSGHYRLSVYYKCSSRQVVRLMVNEGDAVSRNYTSTGDYTGQRPYFITLHEGDNTISFSSSGQVPSIEKMEVSFLSPVNNTLEAEHTITNGKAAIAVDNNASGGQYVSAIGGGSANFITFYYDAESDGDYTLDVTYFAPDDRQMYIRLNNGTKTLHQFEKTGGNSARTKRTKTVTVTLKAGTNTIALGNDSGLAPNVDKIDLHRQEDVTGIDVAGLDRRDVTTDGDAYSLQGIRLKSTSGVRKGIFIIGNKKVVR